MSRNFNAVRIMILDHDATDRDHEGRPYTNVDFPKDTVLCIDIDSNVYRYDMPEKDARNPNNWPRRDDKGIPLFRNYWTFIYNANEPQGPYYRAIENTAKTEILPPIGTNEL